MKPLNLLTVVVCLTANIASDASDRVCAVGSCPQTSSSWTIWPDSAPGAPDFWWKPDAVTVEEISLCAHGIHFVFPAEQDGTVRPTALIFPYPSPELLAGRLGLAAGSDKLACEHEHFQRRYAALLDGLERLSGGSLTGRARETFAPSDPDQPRIVPNSRLALLWRGEELALRGYLDVYFGSEPMIAAAAETPPEVLEAATVAAEGVHAPLRVAPSPSRAGEHRISFGVPSPVSAMLRIVDVQGRVVATLFDGVTQAGFVDVAWNGRSSRGERVAAGVYFVRLATSGTEQSAKLVHLGD
jgi:hypothetical protein